MRFFFVFVLVLPSIAFSQGNLPIHIDDTQNIADVIKALQGPGTEITNITYSMPGQLKAMGYFEDNGGLLGLKKGLIITTEAAQFAVGPNNESGNISDEPELEMNDPDLATVTTGSFFDIAIVEFDIKTLYSKFSFNYVFGSEEYTEFVGHIFNDTFAFFISGPGITGTKNLATLDNGDPITINSINQVVNSDFFISNGDGSTPLINYYIQYDGLTKKLAATTNVTPNETYHIKIIIADVGDNNFDSGVFLEQESFISEIPYDVKVSYEHDRFDYAIEGCNKAFLTIQREAQDATQPLPLDISFEGSASNGNDFTFVQPGPLTLAPGVLTSIIEINPLPDAIPEGDESVITHVTSIITNKAITTQVTIRDEMKYSIDESTICASTPTTINNNPEVNFSFNWEQLDELSCQQCPSPTATLTQSTLFRVEVTHDPSGCQANTMASVKANNFQYNFNDETACYNTATAINKSASNNYRYRWADNQGLSCLNCSSPSITILQNTSLAVEVEQISSGCKINSQLNLNAFNFTFSFEEASVCENTSTAINKNPLPGYAFTWQPHPSLSCVNCASPSVVLDHDVSFSVKVKEPTNGCETTSELPVKVEKVDYKVPDSFVCKDEENAINVDASDDYVYRWDTNSLISCTNCKSPKVKLSTPSSFPVEIEEIKTGCKTKTQAFVKVNTVDYLIAPTKVCENEPTIINNSPSVQYLFQWNSDASLSCLSCASPIITTNSDLQLKVQVEDVRVKCHTKLTVPVSVIKVNYPIQSEEVCINKLSNIHTNFQGDYSFRWLPDGNLSCLSCTSPQVLLQDDKSFLLEVTENKSACKTIVTIPVRVKKIKANFTFALTDHYSSIVADFKNQSEGANEYQWSFGDGNNSSEFEPIYQYAPLGEALDVQLIAINNVGLYCEDVRHSIISIHESVFIPNVITPNGDQYNQVFEAKGIEMGVWSLTIFDSWGNRVHVSKNYQNDWDAENMASGVYYYELRNPQDNKSYKGWVHVMK